MSVGPAPKMGHTTQQDDILLEVEDLHVHFTTREGTVWALRGVDLTLRRGETLGLVGESGCGKSMTARAILNMVPKPGVISKGKVTFYRAGENGGTTATPIEVTKLHPQSREVRQIRGGDIAMIFQEPMTSLSPVHTVGRQIMEAVKLHQGLSKKAAKERAVEMLDLVGIPDAKNRVDTYPFELSGGMRQRAMIAMALSCNPSLLIADEPTTALDVTIQAQILELLQRLQEHFNMTILMITHNLGVVAALAHRVAVMYFGQVVEEGTAVQIFDEPKHPYTQGLLMSVPKVGEKSGKRLWAIKGSVPDPSSAFQGCAFHPRCHEFMPGICDVRTPDFITLANRQKSRCWLHSDDEETARVLSHRQIEEAADIQEPEKTADAQEG